MRFLECAFSFLSDRMPRRKSSGKSVLLRDQVVRKGFHDCRRLGVRGWGVTAPGHDEGPGCAASGAFGNRCRSSAGLLEGNRRAGLFESGLRLVGGLLVGALEDSLGSTVDDGLRLTEAERGELADDLDDLDLLVAGGLEDDVERVLLLLGGSVAGTTGGGARSGNRDRGGGGDVEGLLERLDELAELDERELL